MYALLGDIQFELITYFDGLETQYGADFAEHALIEGKPRLQFIGDKLNEIRIQLSLNTWFCDPEAELAALTGALTAHQAMALVFGNGDYKGFFVLTELQVTARQTDESGTLLAVEASMTLREFVGDKKNPLKPPAVQSLLPMAAAKALPASVSKSVAALTGAGGAIRQAVTLANQAQAAVRVAADGAKLVAALRDNPVAALSRVPGLLGNLKQAAAPLGGLPAPLASLDGLKEAATLLSAATKTLGSVRNAQGALAGVTAGTVGDKASYVVQQLADAAKTLQSVSPSVSTLASSIVTRKI